MPKLSPPTQYGFSVNSIAKTSALQLQKTDIRVNSICPGLIETGMTGATFNYARERGSVAKIGQMNPLGRFGIPEGEYLTPLEVHLAMLIAPVARNCQRRPLPRLR